MNIIGSSADCEKVLSGDICLFKKSSIRISEVVANLFVDPLQSIADQNQSRTLGETFFEVKRKSRHESNGASIQYTTKNDLAVTAFLHKP